MKVSTFSFVRKCFFNALAFLALSTYMNAQCVAAFNSSIGPNGVVTFSSTSTGTTANTYYFWYFGDGGTASGLNLTTTTHTYLAAQVYTPSLFIMDTLSVPSCSSSAAQPFTVTTANCSGNVSFSYNSSPSGMVYFNANTNITSNLNYWWDFGDGISGSGSSTSHLYASSGVYNVTLTAGFGSCTFTSTQALSVTVTPCPLNAMMNVSSTSNNGFVSVNASSSSTTSTTQFQWDFGDGSPIAWGYSQTHTYQTNGTYNILLTLVDTTNALCMDTVSQPVTITNATCIPGPVTFTLSKDTTQALTWNLYPSYPFNVSAAEWFWGDGSSTIGLFPSHTYSGAGTYTICVTVTVACGSTTFACNFNANIYKGGSRAMIGVHVKDINNLTGIESQNLIPRSLSVIPNPSAGDVSINIKGMYDQKTVGISVYNLFGQEVYKTIEPISNGFASKKLHLELPNGTYIVTVNSERSLIVIEK